MDLTSPQFRDSKVAATNATGEGWRVPPNPMPPDTSEKDLAWANPLRVTQPLKTVLQSIRLTGAVERLPRTYIYCRRTSPEDPFRQFAERARTEAGWKLFDIDASHNPHITAPQELAKLMERIISVD